VSGALRDARATDARLVRTSGGVPVSALAWASVVLAVWFAIGVVIFIVGIRRAPTRDDWD
jgi:hypothetical protein